MGKYIIESGHNMVIAMDPTITPELYIEGLKNDVVRHIQIMRKELNLNMLDYIEFHFYGIDCDKIRNTFKKEIEKDVRGMLNKKAKGGLSKYISLGGETVGLIVRKERFFKKLLRVIKGFLIKVKNKFVF